MYPGLDSHPQHALARRQMDAFGGMISIVLKGDLSYTRKVLERCRVFALAESLGGVESLIEHPAIMTHASVPTEQRAAEISDSLIRLSVGVEDVEDLKEDLDRRLPRNSACLRHSRYGGCMNRRRLLQQMAVPLAGLLTRSGNEPLLAAAESIAPATERTPAIAEYERLRFGVSYHFSMNTFTGDDYETGKVPATTYNPTKLDVRQWIRVAHELGAKYAVLTAKHMSGFCLWDSEGYDYDVGASANKTDVVAAFLAACKEFNIRPGFYYCILDPHNEGGKFDWKAPVLPDYYKLIRHHVTELHTRYPGAIYQLFDITWKISQEQRWDLYRLVRS